MRQFIIVLTIQIICLTASAQHGFGVKANGGLSYITTVMSGQNQKFYFRPSGQSGLFYSFHFKNRFYIGAEVLFVPIYGKEYFIVKYTDNNGNYTGKYVEDIIYRYIYNLGIPIYFGSSYKKFNINLGLRTHFVLASGGREIGKTFYNGQLYTWNNRADKLGINNRDYGVSIGLLYKLSDQISIETNYYYGLTNLLKDRSLTKNWTWRVQQVTLGLRYKFFSIDSHKKCTSK